MACHTQTHLSMTGNRDWSLYRCPSERNVVCYCISLQIGHVPSRPW